MCGLGDQHSHSWAYRAFLMAEVKKYFKLRNESDSFLIQAALIHIRAHHKFRLKGIRTF